MRPPDESLDLLEFLDQFEADRIAGRDLPLRHYLERFPQIEGRVAREYLAWHAEAATGPDPGGAPLEAPTPTSHIGPFRVLRELGRGGQGTVYLGFDPRVDRPVALKVLSPGCALAATAWRRFRREAEIVARLEHPHLCTVFEADLDGEPPYIAMRFVTGETLAVKLERARTAGTLPTGPRLNDALLLIEQVARALHVAHEAGVVHRDVKPANIQVALDGQPMVLDFGLAHVHAEQSQQITRPGDAFGTPAYMAPEQCDPRREVDRRADVFALGVTLYEMLTLQSAFPATVAPDGTAWPVDPRRRAPPEDPGALNDAIGRPLAAVLETAMADEPALRYVTALEFAEDLARVRGREPIAARAPGPWARMRRSCRRHRAGLLVAGAIVMTLLGIAGWWIRAVAAERAREAQQAAVLVRSLVQTDPQLALRLAQVAWPESPDDLVNTTAMQALFFNRQRWAATLGGEPRVPYHEPALAVSGRFVAAASRAVVEIHDLVDGALLGRAEPGGGGDVSDVAEDGEGEFFAVWQDGSLRRWTHAKGFVECAIEDPVLAGETILAVRASPVWPGRLLVVTREGGLAMWDRDAERVAFAVRHPLASGAHLSVVVSDDGRRFATAPARARDSGGPGPGAAVGAGRIVVWNAQTGAVEGEFGERDARIHCIVLSPSGGSVAAAYADGAVRAFDVESGRASIAIDYPSCEAFRVAFDPTGARLAVALGSFVTRDLEILGAPVRVLDAVSGIELARCGGHAFRGVMALAFDPSGGRLATGGNDCRLVVRDGAALGDPPRTLARTEGFPLALCWSAEGDLLSLDTRGVLAAWSVDQASVRELVHPAAVAAVAFSADGRRVVSGAGDGFLRWWDRDSGRRLAEVGPIAATPLRVEFVSEGRVFAQGAERCVRLFPAPDAAGHSDGLRFDASAEVTCSTVDARGRAAAFGCADGAVYRHDLETGEVVCVGRHVGAVTCISFESAGERLVSGGADRTVFCWKAGAAGAPLARWGPVGGGDPAAFGRVLAVAAGPAPSWLVSTERPCTVEWNPDSGAVRQLDAPVRIGRIAFDPVGDLVALGALANTVVVRSLGERIEPFTIRAQNLLTALEFGASGKRLLVASLDGTARIVRTDGAPRAWATLSGHSGPILDACFSPDECWVATASADGTVRIWPAEPMDFARRLRLGFAQSDESAKSLFRQLGR